jgi:hypothetical protein
VLQLSGNVAILFTGICHAHYSCCTVKLCSGNSSTV